MPQPRKMPEAQQSSSLVPAAGAAVIATPFVAGAVAPALAAAGAGVLTGAALVQTVKTLVAGFDELAESRFRDDSTFVLSELKREYPQRPVNELEKLVAQELSFEQEFRRKMRARLERDLPEALGIADDEQRRAQLQAIFDREKRYTVARSEAMFLRALGKAEAVTLKAVSPQGAYWKLSPFVKQHTLDCLAMGEKFWPWEVIDDFQPPVHHGCACSLHSLDDAVSAGWMTHDQVPDTQDAIRRARQGLKDAAEMEESLEESAIRDFIDSLALEEAGNVVLHPHRGHRMPLRWEKGLEHGGQFRPSRGGDPGRALRALFSSPRTPLAKRAERRGRWSWINGRYTRIPEADHWEKVVAGHHYTSPAGGTNVYKDGKLIDGLGMSSPEKRRRAVTARPAPPEKIATAADEARAGMRADALGDATVRAPVRDGDGPSSLLALRQAGFRIVAARPASPGTKLTFLNPDTEAQLEVNFDGSHLSDVAWTPVPAPAPLGQELKRPPVSWDEHREDTFAWARELADQNGAPLHLSDLRIDSDLGDHAGWRAWTGEADVGRETGIDIARAGAARKAGRPLTDDEKRGVWSSYWVTAHEVAHSVNPIEPVFYHDENANLEEALAEELAHVMAVTRLTEQGQGDVVKWRAEHPDAPAVKGVYRQERAQLGKLLDEAGIDDQFHRRQFLEELKFRTDPVDRMHAIAQRIQDHSGGDIDALTTHVEEMMGTRGKSLGPALGGFKKSPGHQIVGNAGYGRFAGATLSPDGRELRMKDGSRRRIEKLPIMEDFPELHGLTDGTALVVYRKGQHNTPGLRNSDGSLKDFRYIDTEDRAKRILRAFTGKGSPGTFGLREIHEDGDTPESLAAKLEGERDWTTIRSVPVKRRFDGSYGVGFAGHDGRRLSALGGAKAAAETALMRSEGTSSPDGGMASPGTLFDDEDGWIGSKWFKKLTHTGKGDLHPDEQKMLDLAFGADDAKFKPKPKPDPLVGKKIGGIAGAKAPSGQIPSYDATELELAKSAGGSNGARFAFAKDGGRWLVKTYRGNQDRIASELLANAIYRRLGAKAAVAGTIQMPSDGPDFRQIKDVDIGEPALPATRKGRRVSTGIVVAEPDGRVWIFEPKGGFGGYEHSFPKGGLEHGLTGQQNAHKELWEETGLHAHITGFVGDYEGDTSTTRFYLAVRTGGEPSVSNDSETQDVKLVSPAEAASLLNRDRDKKVLADALAMGLPKDAPPDEFPPDRTKLALTYPTLDGSIKSHFKPSEALGEHYMTDALLGNWDFVGMSGDNILWDDDGAPIRLDQGGTFEFRAQGQAKPFGPVPTEVWTMLAKGQGQRGVIVSEDQMRAQAGDIAKKLTPARIDRLVEAAPFADNEMRERVRDNLKARVGWMKAFAAGTVDLPRPLEGEQAHEDLYQAQGKVKLYPEQEDSLYGFVEGMSGEVNAALAGKQDKSKMTQKVIDQLDSIMRHVKTGEDVIGYAPINLDGKPGDGLEGKTLGERGFLGLQLERPDAPAVVRVTVPAGSAALYTGLWEDMPEDAPDLIVARDSRMRVGEVEDIDGQRVISVTIATKTPYKPLPPMKPLKGGGYKPSGSKAAPAWLIKEFKNAHDDDLSGFYPNELAMLAKAKELSSADRARAQDELDSRTKKVAEAALLEEAKGNTGAMVALYPSPAEQKALSVPGGEPTEEIHLTLAFLGDAADLDGEKLKTVVQGFAASCPPLEGEISGIGKFTAGPKPVTYVSADLPDLPEQRERLVALLDGAGLKVSRAHGFTPHMTLAYDDREVAVKAKPIRFKTVTVKLGDERTDFPLAGA